MYSCVLPRMPGKRKITDRKMGLEVVGLVGLNFNPKTPFYMVRKKRLLARIFLFAFRKFVVKRAEENGREICFPSKPNEQILG